MFRYFVPLSFKTVTVTTLQCAALFVNPQNPQRASTQYIKASTLFPDSSAPLLRLLICQARYIRRYAIYFSGPPLTNGPFLWWPRLPMTFTCSRKAPPAPLQLLGVRLQRTQTSPTVNRGRRDHRRVQGPHVREELGQNRVPRAEEGHAGRKMSQTTRHWAVTAQLGSYSSA